MVLDYKGRNDIGNWTCINYLQYVQSRWGLRTPSLLRAGYLPNPTHLEGEVRYDQAQDQQMVTTRSPRIVTECLLTRSMYVYAIYSRFRIETILSIRKHGYEFITTLSLSSLMCSFSIPVDSSTPTTINAITMTMILKWRPPVLVFAQSFAWNRKESVFSNSLHQGNEDYNQNWLPTLIVSHKIQYLGPVLHELTDRFRFVCLIR